MPLGVVGGQECDGCSGMGPRGVRRAAVWLRGVRRPAGSDGVSSVCVRLCARARKDCRLVFFVASRVAPAGGGQGLEGGSCGRGSRVRCPPPPSRRPSSRRFSRGIAR
ncbi:hypothetical protein E2C01_010436 [Portunus trituberculatus]|uniref:Uncharacterized protein n=1 Tax=Portunus trituberculatus TaxID=210409 RepID=A0A5B7D8M2_PORTR|nr:hypothetical protein [Portunus trituberculatus]